MNQNKPTYVKPGWWTDEYDTSWNSARDSVRRDWLGNDPARSTWDADEPAVRYGYGASNQYKSAHAEWDKAEAKLKEEWNDLKSGRTWDEIKGAVRKGWDAARGKPSAR